MWSTPSVTSLTGNDVHLTIYPISYLGFLQSCFISYYYLYFKCVIWNAVWLDLIPFASFCCDIFLVMLWYILINLLLFRSFLKIIADMHDVLRNSFPCTMIWLSFEFNFSGVIEETAQFQLAAHFGEFSSYLHLGCSLKGIHENLLCKMCNINERGFCTILSVQKIASFIFIVHVQYLTQHLKCWLFYKSVAHFDLSLEFWSKNIGLGDQNFLGIMVYISKKWYRF